MDFTSRMAALLRQMHRQRNGAVAASMGVYGKPCGLNYGVSLPTVRQIARSESPGHDFARYLFLQDVRELRLAALHLADSELIVLSEFSFWGAGIVNSEVAEEAAFALLGRVPVLPELFRTWIVHPDPLLVYTVLLAAARAPFASIGWAESALDAVHRFAQAEAEKVGAEDAAAQDVGANAAAESGPDMSLRIAPGGMSYAAHLVAKGAVALLAALGARNEENRQAVFRAAGSLGKLPSEDFVHEELAWRLEA